ncbi:MAG: hypothetical protein RI900_805 [Actinomycetota bacterium]
MSATDGMQLLPRRFHHYVGALAVAYEDEAAGIAFYDELASRHDGARAEALLLFRDLEVLSTRALEPLVERNRAPVFRGPVLDARGRREVLIYLPLPWDQLMRRLLRDHLAFVMELQQVVDLAPEQDKETVAAVTDVERSIVQFVEREIEGHPDSTEMAREVLSRLQAIVDR